MTESQESNEREGLTTVQIKFSTRDRLAHLGKKGETYDELVNRILNIFELKRADEILEELTGKN